MLNSSYQPYDDAFFADLHAPSERSAAEIAPQMIEWIGPRSVIDIGCGDGSWLSAFARLGVGDVLGVDGSYVNAAQLRIEPGRFRSHDLTEPLDVGRRFDLGLCLEVAEHLAGDRSNTLIESLVRHAPVVLFSAAIPGQGGTHHVNEQWPQFWADRFASFGYAALDVLRPILWENRNIAWWYAQNAILYAEQSWIDAHPRLRGSEVRFGAKPLVHPALYAKCVAELGHARDPSLKQLLKRLPGAMLESVAPPRSSR